MSTLWEGSDIGDVLVEHSVELSRDSLVRYAGASGDFNPIHYRDDVIASANPTNMAAMTTTAVTTMTVAASIPTIPWEPKPKPYSTCNAMAKPSNTPKKDS